MYFRVSGSFLSVGVCMRERIYEGLFELFDILTPETDEYENLQY